MTDTVYLPDSRLVGIVGAYGDVGRAAVGWLRAHTGLPLRLGGRDLTAARSLAAEVGAEARHVDVFAADSLDAFCAGCATVLNCAGPAERVGAVVAAAARRAGAAYVDAAGDDPLHDALTRMPWRGAPAIVGAGMMPGLTGLLPRVLAGELTRPRRLTAYVGGCDVFTRTAARDYLAAVTTGYGEAGAAWRAGARARNALRTLADVHPPGFPGAVTAVPYLSTETERLAADLGLTEVDWYSVFTGDRVVAALTSGADADELCAAAALDAFGRERHQILSFTLEGVAGDRPHTVSLTRRAGSAGTLTGMAAALAALAVAADRVAPGVHHFAAALDPEWAAGTLGVVEEEGAL